jgi:hypothetical protein
METRFWEVGTEFLNGTGLGKRPTYCHLVKKEGFVLSSCDMNFYRFITAYLAAGLSTLNLVRRDISSSP